MITAPTIHLNGTSKDSLLSEFEAAATAIRVAREKLADAGPHGRDYYPQGMKAIQQAEAEHDARLAKLQEVLVEVEELWQHVFDS